MHQNIILLSNGVDRVPLLWKIPTRLCGTNFYTSSTRFVPSFIRQPNGPKCTHIVQTGPKHEFRVQWGGSCAFVAKNSDATSWHGRCQFLILMIVLPMQRFWMVKREVSNPSLAADHQMKKSHWVVPKSQGQPCASEKPVQWPGQ